VTMTAEDKMANIRRRLREVMFTTEPGEGDLPWKPRKYDRSGEEVCQCDVCTGTMQDGLS
jgi:hypothetical protein